MKRSLRLFWLVLCLISLFAAGIASAATGTDITLTVTCDGFVSGGGTITYASDETVVIRAFDADGTRIYDDVISGGASGRYSFPNGQQFAWEREPSTSPIIVSIITSAPSIDEQDLLFLVVGECDELPSGADAFGIAADAGVLPVLTNADGRTAPSVPLGVAPPRPTNPEEYAGLLSGHAVVNTDNLFMRSGPGTEYTPVGIVDGGTVLVVLGRNDDGLPDDSFELWWYVEVGGLRGWVSSGLLALRGDLTGVPVVPSQGERIPPTVYVGFTGTRIYAQADGGSAVLCGIRGDRFYLVVGRDTVTENWYLVEAQCENGRIVEGWLSIENVILRNDGEVSIPVVGS
jgi:hypothetical protein